MVILNGGPVLRRHLQRWLEVYSVVMLGESGVGKTNLTQCFFRNDPNFRSTTPTIGIEYSAPMLDLADHRHVKLQIWDTAGQEQYRAMTSEYSSLHSASCVRPRAVWCSST